MATEHRATCSCGRLVLTCTGDPVRVSVCHCLECQRRTGSVFAVQARWPRERVHIEGEPTRWDRVGDEGGVATFHFCPVCGATVYWTMDRQPDVVAVAVGALADPSFVAPSVSVYGERKHAWVTLPDGAEQFD